MKIERRASLLFGLASLAAIGCSSEDAASGRTNGGTTTDATGGSGSGSATAGVTSSTSSAGTTATAGTTGATGTNGATATTGATSSATTTSGPATGGTTASTMSSGTTATTGGGTTTTGATSASATTATGTTAATGTATTASTGTNGTTTTSTTGTAGTTSATGSTTTGDGSTGGTGRDGGGTNTSTGSTGDGGTGTSSGLHGGASAKFICPGGATYGNPLTGMGAVATINPPTTGTVTYFAFIEGPVWIASMGTLFFSDNASSPMERIWKVVPPSTTPSVFLENSGSNGLAIDNDDELILTDQRNHRITRVDPATGATPTVVVPVGSFKPNDIIVRSDGNMYFTDPDTGFYRVSPSGALTGPLKMVGRPNGIELSLDETTLFVGDVGNKQIHKISLMADGTVGTDAMFVTAKNDTVDGMCVDCAGNLYASTSMGVEVYNMTTAAYVGIVPTGESSNCTFGGADRKTLYVTSRAVLKSVALAVPGMPD